MHLVIYEMKVRIANVYNKQTCKRSRTQKHIDNQQSKIHFPKRLFNPMVFAYKIAELEH